jgi:hypothetical protein
MTRGSPKRRAGALLPSAVTEGSATRSKAGLARTQPCPTRSVSSKRVLTSRALACRSLQAGVATWASRLSFSWHQTRAVPAGYCAKDAFPVAAVLAVVIVVVATAAIGLAVLRRSVTGWGKEFHHRRLCRWWQVLGSNQRRLSRRFYRPFLPDHWSGT